METQKIPAVQDSKGLKKVVLRRMALLGKTWVDVFTGQTQTRRYKRKGGEAAGQRAGTRATG